MRYLLLFLLVLFGIWWIRRALHRSDDRDSGSAPGGRERPGPRNRPEAMLACRHCGVHVPESEGVRVGEDFYCCEEHRRLGRGR